MNLVVYSVKLGEVKIVKNDASNMAWISVYVIYVIQEYSVFT